MWILGLKGLSEDVLSGARQPEVMRFPLIIRPNATKFVLLSVHTLIQTICVKLWAETTAQE